MKQGTSGRSFHGKDPGRARGVSPGAVSQLGSHVAYLKSATPPTLFTDKGRGSSAPGYKVTQHGCGSQGKH